MSERPPGGGEGPPDEPSSGWDAIVEEVEAALDDAGVMGEATREALLGALGDALEQLGVGVEGDLRVEIETTGEDDHDGPPGVTVVDGGRGRNQPRSPKPRPELWVADGQPGDSQDAGDDDGSPLPARVKVFRLGSGPGRHGHRSSLRDQGWIRVDADARQALYRGEDAHPYRVACAKGRLAVSVDGVTVETLGPGQSCDVVGRAVVVLAADEGPAAGSYARLS